jgi:uncharacterized LabA/DUF88 family protein
MQKIAIFVDVQNIYYTTKQTFQRHFNYHVFWQQVTQDKEVIAAFAYAIDKGDQKQQGFQNILKNIGFQVKLKPYIQRSDGSSKGDWDVGITLDVLDYAHKADQLILLSGDGDFDLLLNKVRLISQAQSLVYGVTPLTAPSLIKAADQFIAIDAQFLL